MCIKCVDTCAVHDFVKHFGKVCAYCSLPQGLHSGPVVAGVVGSAIVRAVSRNFLEVAPSKLFLQLARYFFISSRYFSREPSYFRGDLKPSVFYGARFSEMFDVCNEHSRSFHHIVSFGCQPPLILLPTYLEVGSVDI